MNNNNIHEDQQLVLNHWNDMAKPSSNYGGKMWDSSDTEVQDTLAAYYIYACELPYLNTMALMDPLAVWL